MDHAKHGNIGRPRKTVKLICGCINETVVKEHLTQDIPTMFNPLLNGTRLNKVRHSLYGTGVPEFS
jgi:hypothetical protein